jgi:hypothetical protein
MRISTVFLAFLVALLGPSALTAQTPATTQEAGTLIEITVHDLAPDLVATTGIIRTIFTGGSTLQLVTGSGPSLHYVESGALTVSTADGTPPVVTHAGTVGEAASPAATPPEGDVSIAAGDGFLLSPGTTVKFHNDGAEAAVVLDLLAAPDATSDAGEGVTQEILVRQEVTLPAPSVSVTLSRYTLGRNDHVSKAEAPALTFFTAVERNKAFNLTGQGFNRLAVPVDVYVMVIAPTPAAQLATSSTG